MYDVIIIGAGIGGLVCGCYLAKAGMKVLMVEQHDRPGGYCTSFKRGPYLFDAGPHCFGSYRPGGQMRRVLEGLGIAKRMTIHRTNPCDVIITPDHQISFWTETPRTIEELEALFPREREHIRAFFGLLTGSTLQSFVQLRRLTMGELLDQYFADRSLKELLALPLLAIGGLPPSKMSACVGAQFYTEFILDGGYMPDGGMQKLSDSLADCFRDFGGTLILSRKVEKIFVKDRTITGVNIAQDGFVPTKCVVSNGDARQTFLALLDESEGEPAFIQSIKGMVPSLSSFLIYLGMDEDFCPPFNAGTVNYHFDEADAEKAYRSLLSGDIQDGRWYAIRSSLDKRVVYVEMLSPFKDEDYWRQKKEMIVECVINNIEASTVPDISRHIRVKVAATPATLQRYTLNYKGASYGWAGTPAQTIVPGFRKPSFVQNLYLVGHWTTLAVGVSGVAYVGYDTAALLIKKRNRISSRISA